MNPANLIVAVLGCVLSLTATAQSSSPSSSFSATAYAQTAVLPDLVVYRKNELKNVTYEADNSISLNKLDIDTVQQALASGDGVAVNFDIEFARKTGVMTAEGKHVMDILLDAIRYVKPGVSYEIEVYGDGKSVAKSKDFLSDNRAQVILSRLENRYGKRHHFELTKGRFVSRASRARTGSDSVDIWSFSLAPTRQALSENLATAKAVKQP